ncbi:hypothetical protein [Lysobacter sp. Root494]|uniref:hypothetical protein n=1 Tax=Lysobacter sp. Root494 TaxID=1736549 RepID=UPI0012FCDA09|nr:hypothetical protein [Lysobacter sp. Root494]
MANILLITALALPVVLFWLLRSRSRLSGVVASIIAVAAGWAMNVAWAFVAHESVAIAGAFGWVCPAVLVLITWLAWRFTRRRREAQ